MNLQNVSKLFLGSKLKSVRYFCQGKYRILRAINKQFFTESNRSAICKTNFSTTMIFTITNQKTSNISSYEKLRRLYKLRFSSILCWKFIPKLERT